MKTIPPAGIERDRLIADIKELGYHVSDECWIDSAYIVGEKCLVIESSPYSNVLVSWSRSKYWAWQLWNELPPRKQLDENMGRFAVNTWESHSMRKNHGDGKTFPEAVSEAWIKMKWREKQ